jgi:hypothetical protein
LTDATRITTILTEKLVERRGNEQYEDDLDRVEWGRGLRWKREKDEKIGGWRKKRIVETERVEKSVRMSE